MKLGSVADNAAVGDGIAHAQEMRVVGIKRADGQTAGLEAEAPVIARFAQDKQGLAFDRLLAQGKLEQFRAHPLLLKIGGHGHGGQVQAADVVAMVGRRKGDVGDGLVDMDAVPFVQGSLILVEPLHQLGFVVTAGKGALQQGVDLGAVLDRYFLNFHNGFRWQFN